MRLGVIGVGAIGRVHAENIASLVPGARLSAIADVNAERRRAVAERLGISAAFATHTELLATAHIDAVVICTPRGAHAPMIIEAAKAGRHIFCEKPLAGSVGECDEALAAVAAAGVTLQVGFNRRFDASFLRAHDAVAAGGIGEPRLLHIVSRDPAPLDGPAYRSPPDLLFETTIHDFDVARFLTGGEVVEVYAAGLAASQPGRLEGAVVTLRFQNGALATIDNHLASAFGYDQRVEAFGTEGAISVENEAPPAAPSDIPFFAKRYAYAYVAEMTSFAECTRQGSEPLATGLDGREAVVLAEAAMHSLKTGGPVQIKEWSAK